MYKNTSYLSEIKTFFKNSDMTAAMQNLSPVLSGVKMAEKTTLALQSKSNCVYKLLRVFQALLLFPWFGVKNAWNKQKYGMKDSVIKARKDVFYRFMENPDVD